MVRRVGAGVSLLALLVGFAASPYTHAHPAGHGSLGDGHHRRDATRHAHLTHHLPAPSHSHDPEGSDTDHDGSSTDVLAAGDFVFQAVASPIGQAPAVPTAIIALADLTSVWFGVLVSGPPVHGPPAATSSSPRAPPVLPAVLL